jgi:hypothetical protein
MAKIGLVFFTICLTFVTIDCEDRNYIWNVYNKAGGEKTFQDIKTWRESYKKSVYDSIAKLPQPVKDVLIEKANKANKKEWVSKLVKNFSFSNNNFFLSYKFSLYLLLKATQYLEYVTIGNRVNFEHTDMTRRAHLVDLAIGEMLTKKGTYINQLCNGLWLILEESNWEIPALLPIQKAGHYLI